MYFQLYISQSFFSAISEQYRSHISGLQTELIDLDLVFNEFHPLIYMKQNLRSSDHSNFDISTKAHCDLFDLKLSEEPFLYYFVQIQLL